MPRIFTEEGLKKIEVELEDRKSRVRQEIAHSIKEAKEQGDLSENAEYTEAKHNQSENEARIAELEVLLKESVVAAPHKKSSRIQVGSKLSVKLHGKEMEFEIVGANEVDPANGKISSESPLGKEFMGKEKGEVVTVTAPSGNIKYEILSVK